MEACSLLLGRP
jgi:hypothetical protein